MLNELSVSAAIGIVVLFALYFVIKHGVKNGIKQYFSEKQQEEAMKAQLEQARTEKEE